MSNKQKTFTFEYMDEDGVVQSGTFTAKRLSVMDRSKMSVRRSQLSGGFYCVRDEEGKPTGQGIDPETDFVNHMIAHLELSLIQRPKWFKFEEITDFGLINDLYEKVMDFEKSFFRRRDQQAAEGSQSNGSGKETSDQQSPQQTDRPPTAQVVGQEVQAALDA